MFNGSTGGSGAPWPVLKPLDSDSSPHQELGLQPGQLVRVKSKHAIESTLNRKLRNRGLEFGTDMLFCCGGSYRVAARVNRIYLNQIKSWEAGQKLTLAANDKYWGDAPAYTERDVRLAGRGQRPRRHGPQRRGRHRHRARPGRRRR